MSMNRKKKMDPAFRHNDFDAVYYDYFQDIWDSGQIYADPSGWRYTGSDSANLLPDIDINKADFGRYYLDEGNTLGDLKEGVVQLLESWEAHPLDVRQVTLYSSVSMANASVLIMLRKMGIESIFFETPAYGVTINQAKQCGHSIELLPTYYRDNFALDLSSVKRNGPVALWLTQPRMSLGIDQNKETILRLLHWLSDSDFLIVDEATEQRWPSILHSFAPDQFPQVLRIRGLLKPMGLNGLRLSSVIHSTRLREELEGAQAVTGASLDLYSLQMAAELGRNQGLFSTMLNTSNAQVTALRQKASRLALGSGLRLSKLVNGYMGTAFIPLNGDVAKYNHNRTELLRFCHSIRMPVILGANMFFAFDPEWEQVRLNYFNMESHIIAAIKALGAFSRRIKQKTNQRAP